MTVIAAMVHRGKVYMASDSGATASDSMKWPDITKVVRLPFSDGGHALVATAGDVSLLQLFTRGIVSVTGGPKNAKEADGWAYAVSVALTQAAADSKPTLVSDASGLAGECLLAAGGGLWALDANSSLRVKRFASIGSGSGYAMGAMSVLEPEVRKGTLPPEAAVRRAAEAAVEWCVSCHGKILADKT